MSLPFGGWSVVFGEIPTAAKWSELGANDDALAAGTGLNAGVITPDKLMSGAATSWTWQTWVPTWTNLTEGTSPTTSYRYTQVGKTVMFSMQLEFGTSPSVTANPLFTLPVTPKANAFSSYQPMGLASMSVVIAGTFYFGAVYMSSGAGNQGVLIALHDSDPVSYGGITSTSPFTWVSGSLITINGYYEAA